MAAQLVRGQLQQPLLEQQAGGEPHRRHRHQTRRDRQRRAEREQQERGGEQRQHGHRQPAAPVRGDEPPHRRVARQHSQRAAGEQQPRVVGCVGHVQGLAADDQSVGHPQREVDEAARPGGPQQGVGPPGGGHRDASRGAGRPPAQAEPGGDGARQVQRGSRQQGAAGLQEGDQHSAERVAADLHDAGGHVQHRAPQEITVLRQHLVEQSVPHPAAQRGQDALHQQDGERDGHRQPRQRLHGGTRREHQQQSAQRGPRRQPVGRGQQRRRPDELGQRRSEHGEGRQQRGAGGPVDQRAQRQPAHRLPRHLKGADEEERGELRRPEQLTVGAHAVSLGRRRRRGYCFAHRRNVGGR
ncbi:hypothetical protein STAL104432_29420 [Streptomyces albus]